MASFPFWNGVLIIVFGLVVSLASLISGILYPVIIAISLIFTGFVFLIFAHQRIQWRNDLTKFLVGGIFLIAGFTTLFYLEADVQALSIFFGSVLLINSMLILWMAMVIKKEEGWVWIFSSGVFSFLLGTSLILQWPVNGFYPLLIGNGFILFQAGILLIRWGNAKQGTGNEIKKEWDDLFREEMELLKAEFFKYQMEIKEIQLSISALRDELNQKIDFHDMDPRMLRISQMVSDLQEDLKSVNMMAEKDISRMMEKDIEKGLETNIKIKNILEDMKVQFEEISKIYRNSGLVL